MSKSNRVTSEIRCIGCGQASAYERRASDNLWELYCPDCNLIFDWDKLPKECRGCKKRLYDADDLGRGVCPTCRIAEWSPEKRAAMNKIIGMAFKKVPPTEAEKDAAIDEAFREL